MKKPGLAKITKAGKALFLAYDHGMEHGTVDFDDTSVDPACVLEIAEAGHFTGFICQKGIAEKYYDKRKNKVPLILKLNGKTNLRPDEEPYSPQVCSVEEATLLGAAAVGYTVYVGSQHEAEMTAEFARIEQEAEEKGLPLIGWMYPRGKAVAGRECSKEILSYAARIGLELGAEMIKVSYTGSPQSFSWVVKAAGRTKVVVAGGGKVDKEAFLRMAEEIVKAGACGLAVGRNIWRAKDPLKMAEEVARIIFK